MFIISTLGFLFFMIQFLLAKRKVETNRSKSFIIYYYSTYFFFAMSGLVWFVILLANIIFIVYTMLQG